MKTYFLIMIMIVTISSIFAASSEDLSLSNYDLLNIANLTGVFDIDFDKKLVHGDLNYFFTLNRDNSGELEIILDTNNLNITNVSKLNENGELGPKLEFSLGELDPIRGKALTIKYGEGEFKEGDKFAINIKYSTTKEGKSAHFLDKNQTIGKTSPVFFTISKMIVGRHLIPIQDTPAKRLPFYLGIKVPKDLRGMMSGLLDKEEEKGDSKIFYYKQEHNVPNYLISLAAGKFDKKDINENITVYCEKEFIDKAVKNLDEFPLIFNYTLDYLGGEYVWKKFNILILPNFLPYTAIENPNLVLCSQSVLDDKKTLLDILVHRLMQDWAGNLVTNDNWADYWIPAGISLFLRRKIMGKLRGEDYVKMDATIGLVYIGGWSEYFGRNSSHSTLRPDYQDADPDDYYSDIPFEKGYNLLYYIESFIGEDNMKLFLNKYLSENKFKSIYFTEFKDSFNSFCTENNIENKMKDEDWVEWREKPGDPPVDNQFRDNKYKKQCDSFISVFENATNGTLNDSYAAEVIQWNHFTKVCIIISIEVGDNSLTDEQHKILYNQLKLYDTDSLIISSGYFRMILYKTDKFIEKELENLQKLLSTYGAYDYMGGVYESYYKRDEVGCVNMFNKMKESYHPIYRNLTEIEINYQKEFYPILTVDLEQKDKCSLLSELADPNKLALSCEEFPTFEKIKNEYDIPEGIVLVIDNKTMNVSCSIKSDEKYCKILGGLSVNKTGEYTLKVPQRIQKGDFSIKVHESKVKFYSNKTEVNKSETKETYDIDYKENQNTIKIHFIDIPDDKVTLMNGDKEIKCTKNEKVFDCVINKDVLPVDKDKPKEAKAYKLNVTDICGNVLHSFNVNVKNTEEKAEEQTGSGSKTWVIVIIIIIAVILIIAVICLIRVLRKKNNKDIEVNKVKEGQLLDL